MSTSPTSTLDPTDNTHLSESDELMTTATASTPNAATTATRTRQRVTSRGVIQAEWIKFWSVRSTSITLLAAGFATVAFGMIFSAVAESGEATGPASLLSDPVDIALGGIGLTEMVIGVLGVMFVAGEYSTGLIRTAFAAVGKRGRVIRAKAAVLAASIFGVAIVAVTTALIAGQAVYAGSEATTPVTDVLDVVFGTSVYLVGIGLIGAALGFILRSNAAGIGTLVGGVFIGPNLLNLLPDSITDVFMKYLPSEAGSAMMTQVSNPDLLSRGSAYAVFAAWVVGLLALAGWLVQRRDA
jgi:ABC-type transport system involved in multi-copper enzyme maturation permease subunit